MSKLNLFFVAMVLIFVNIIPCFAQDFEGTNFSRLKPSYGEPPYQFEIESYSIFFKTDPKIIRLLVPEPLTPAPNSNIHLYFAKCKGTNQTIELDYYEVAFLIPVSFNDKNGSYISLMYLDKTPGILAGREIYGFNKVGADIRFEGDDKNMVVTVSQSDTVIIKASFVLGDPFVLPTQEMAYINLKYIPSVIKDAPPDVKQLTYTKTENSKMTQSRMGSATLEFHSSKYNPLDKIPILGITGAVYTKFSLTLPHGEVLYDYLKEKK